MTKDMAILAGENQKGMTAAGFLDKLADYLKLAMQL